MATETTKSETVREKPSLLATGLSALRSHYHQWVIYFAFLALIVAFSSANHQFMTFSNIINILRQTSILAIMGFAMTFVLTAGEIDLSVGSVMAVGSLVASICLRDGSHWLVASLAGVGSCVLFGAFNGVLTTKAQIPSFLVTLGSQGIARGIALSVTGTLTIVFVNDTFTQVWGLGDIGPIPTLVVWMIVAFIITYFLFNHTLFGRYVQATGGNLLAARFSGVNTDRVKLVSLMMSSGAAGLGGLLMTARLVSGRPYIGEGFELDVISAVILGGTSLFGGRGTIAGTLIGALIIGVINNGLVLLGVQTNVQMIVKGAIIIAAVFFGEKAI